MPPTAVNARSWCRIDLAGGTLDIWPLGLLHPGARTVNVAIDLAAEVTLTRRKQGYRVSASGIEKVVETATAEELATDATFSLVGRAALAMGLPPCEARLHTDSPRGAGLGGSSALTVALLAAGEVLQGRSEAGATMTLDRARRIAALARDVEAQLMSLPTGTQDHYTALLGGALSIRHQPGGADVARLAGGPELGAGAFAASLVIAYTGQSHFSAGANWSVVRRRLDGDREVRELFAGIARTAEEVEDAFRGEDLPRLGRLLSEEWSYRRQLSPEVSTPFLEELLALAGERGAWGGKACGAGGGGSIAVLCPPERRAEVSQALAAAGAQILETAPVGEPLTTRLEAS